MSDINYIDDELDDDGDLLVNIQDANGDTLDIFMDIIDLQLIANVFGCELTPIGGLN